MNKSQQIAFLKKLIQCKSVTPNSKKPIDLISKILSKHGFQSIKLQFSDDDPVQAQFRRNANKPITNLYAQIGQGKKNLCFAGHVDVVPAGPAQMWDCAPFKGEIKQNVVYGRGAVDMKGSIVAFLGAAIQFLNAHPVVTDYKISFLLSGDEEWESKNGTIKLLDWLKKNGHNITECIVGEPTSREIVGDTIKNGSRGSLLFRLVVRGTQGHVAYNKQADNPVTRLVQILHVLKKTSLDKGSKFFEPSNLEVTTIDVGNPVSNVIPAEAKANFCIRFNDYHSPESLKNWVERIIQRYAKCYQLSHQVSGPAYIVKDKKLIQCIKNAIKQVQNITPIVSAAGATSDARFIKDFCSVVELGPLIKTAHKTNEHIPLKDLFSLTKIYYSVIEKFFYDQGLSLRGTKITTIQRIEN